MVIAHGHRRALLLYAWYLSEKFDEITIITPCTEIYPHMKLVLTTNSNDNREGLLVGYRTGPCKIRLAGHQRLEF